MTVFSSTAAHALKATLDDMTRVDQQQYLASVTQAYPRWLLTTTTTTSGEILTHQQAATQANWAYLGGGIWQVPPQHDEKLNPMPEELMQCTRPVAVMKRCTCGGASVGGGHSDWCDLT